MQAAYADDLGAGVLSLSKTTTVTEASAGTEFTYTLNFGCSSTTTGCVNATITDPVPAPLTIAGTPSILGSSGAVSANGNTVTIVFGDPVPNTTPASTGLPAGVTGTVQIPVKVPDDLAKSFDADILTNTATFTARNASIVQASAPVTLRVPDIIRATAVKTWTPAATQYNAGELSTATLTATSASNIDATSLTITEPADPTAAGGIFDFYDLAGFGDVVFPDGSDRVQVVAITPSGSVDGPVGAAPALPSGIAAADVIGLRFVFSSSRGAAITPGASGSAQVVFAQRTTDRRTGDALVAGGTRVNAIAATVNTPKGDSAPAGATASEEIAPLTVSVSADKSFSIGQLPAGSSTTATLTATNTSTGPLTSLSLSEPGTGTFFSDKIGFGGFTSDATWPDGATNAVVTWSVDTGTAPADSPFTAASGIPAVPALSPGQHITGFRVTYTGSIATGATAKLPFTVDTTTDAGPAGSGFTTYPNTATATGANAAGAADDTATANLDVYFPQVALTLDKTIAPATVIPGGASLVQLSAQTPTGTSSVRPHTIVITEPQEAASAPYWNAFDAIAIAPTSVPAGSTLLIEYTTDGTVWNTLDTADATSGAETYSSVLDDALPNGTTHTDVRGLRFTFTDPHGFGQATNVKPSIVFVARGTLRDGSGPTNPGAYPALTSYENCSVSSASGSVNGGPPIVSDPAVDCANANVQATTGGPGSLIASKAWDGTKILQAQSGATTGVTLGWGTQTTGMQSMVIQDPGTPSPVRGSAYQAFDLVKIDPITATQTDGATYDPLIRYDKVSKVELFDGTTWNDVTAHACTSATACDGTFPGYTLSNAERSSTQGVRLTVIESPNRAAAIQATGDPMAPLVGSGVASASAGAFPGADANARTIHLALQLRNAVRGGATTDWVTGTRDYNMAGSPGLVDNTVLVRAIPATGSPFEGSAGDHVTIIDPTLTTKTTKTANPTTLVIPQPDVNAASYPSTVYTTTIANTSTTNTWQLRVSDPVDCTNARTTSACVFGAYDPASNPLDKLNLTKIAIGLSSAPGVQTSLSVVSLLHRAPDGTLTTDTRTVAQANALTATQLSDVVGVSVLLRGTNAQGTDGSGPTIAPGQKATVTLTAKLRPTSRATGAAPTAGAFTNTVFGVLHDDIYPSAQASDVQSAAVTLANGNLQVATTKTFTPASTLQASPANPIQVDLRARSTGTLSPKALVIEDSAATFWNAFTLNGFTIPNPPTGADRVSVDAQTGQGASATWHTGTATVITGAALPAGVAAADVTGLRVTFTKADGSAFAASNNANNLRLSVSLRTTLRDGSGPVRSTAVNTPMPGETTAGTITNTVLADASYNDVHATQARATARFTVDPGTASIAVEKTSPGQAASGKEVLWTLRFKNTGTGYLLNPIVTDTLPADGSLLYVPTNVPLYNTSIGGTLPTDAATVTRVYDATTGTIRFAWPTGSRLAPGETFSITISLQIQPGLAPSSVVTNTFGVTTDNALTAGACTAMNPGNGRPVSFAANTCSTNNIVTTLSQGSFTASKGVRSATGTAQNINDATVPCTADTDGYYRYPCAALSAIGGTDHWKLEMINGGNVAAKSLTAIDVFPHSGDVGVVDPSYRGSVYTPRFNGDTALHTTGGAAGTRMDWYVTTSASPCTQEIRPGAGPCPAGSWLPSSALDASVDPAQVTAVKMVFDFTGTASGALPAGSAVKVTYSSTNVPTTASGDDRAPVTAPVTGVRAWNSFGFSPTYASGSQSAGPQEPIKSGVILAGGPLEITKSITGSASSYAPTSFVADIACTVDGVAVDLGASSSVTLSAAASYTARIDGIPLGASCSVTEHGADGSYGESSRTVTPSSAVITTTADAAAPVPAAQHVSITNDYATTQLTVTKHVETSATIGTFGPFDLTLRCTSALGTPVPLTTRDAAFTLKDGDAHTVTGLPVGARCAVTETDAAGAATSPNHIGISFNGAAETTGDTATVTLTNAADGNTAEVTNHYAAGTLTVTKTLTGDAANDYGSGPFTIHVTCVRAGTETLYDDDLVINGGESLTVPGIYPSGTECSVEETVTGGATGTTIDTPSVVIPGNSDGTTANVTVDVTNTFSAGSVAIQKVRTGTGVATYGAGPFTAQLTCTWVKDGTTLTIPLPGSGIVVLDAANGYRATLSGLIRGAHCDTVERTTGGANAVVVAPAGGVTVSAGGPAEVTITNTFPTGSLTIGKQRIGDGVGLFGAGPFTVHVACTYDVDGVSTPIDLGADATRELSNANGYTTTIGNLIAGSSCAVAETDPGLATRTTLDPSDGTVEIPSESTATVTITNRFDIGHLSIQKSADRTVASVGDTIVYTIIVTNDGQIDATEATVTDQLPTGVRVTGTSPAAVERPGTLTWTIPALAAGSSTTFTVTGVVTDAAEATNGATVSTPSGPWTPSTAAGACGDPAVACAVVKPQTNAGLASTGSDQRDGLLWALGLLIAGVAAVTASRLRGTATRKR